MTQRQSFGVLVCYMVVSLGVLAAASWLCAIGKLNSDAVVALFGAAIALLGSNAQQLGSAAVNGGAKPDLTKLALANPEILESVMRAQAGHRSGAADETTRAATAGEHAPAGHEPGKV